MTTSFQADADDAETLRPLQPGEALTVFDRSAEPMTGTQFGNVTYGQWCELEAARIGQVVVQRNGGMCRLVKV